MKTGFLALFRGSVMMFLCIINISAVIEKGVTRKALLRVGVIFKNIIIMTTATTMQPHYPVQVAAFETNLSGSKSWGPLTINYNIDTSIPQFALSGTLLGISIGSIVINTNNPSGTIGGSIGFATAEATLTANFSTKTVSYSVTVGAFGSTKSFSGTLFTW